MHVHVYCAEGEAKFWLEPEIALAYNHSIRPSELTAIQRVVEEHKDEIATAWHAHFRR
jgi:hypothetical protein